jgi:hypothetical protein
MTRAEWVEQLAALARAKDVAKFGRDKFYIASLERAAQKEPKLHRKDFRAELLEAHRAGLLELARADLPSGMDPKLVEASALHPIPGFPAVYHFVVFRAWAAKQTPAEAKREARAAAKVDWEAYARTWYAVACGAVGVDPGPNAPRTPKHLRGDPRASAEFIVASGAAVLHPRADNPARVLVSEADARRAFQRFRVFHWGLGGDGKIRDLRAADPSQGVLTQLGTLREVTYETSKAGDPPRTWYTHEFKSPLPVLAYSDGGLVICGGDYRVRPEGIVD